MADDEKFTIDPTAILRVNNDGETDVRDDDGLPDHDEMDYVEVKGNQTGHDIDVAAKNDGSDGAADTDGEQGVDFNLSASDGGDGGAHSSNNPDGGRGGDVELTPGSGGSAGSGGSGVAGRAGHVKANGLFFFNTPQTIDMDDAQVALTLVPGTPTGTEITSNILYVDANSGATEDLLLPPEADAAGLMLMIANTGGESIVIKEDGDSTTIHTLLTATNCILFCDGTTWEVVVDTDT